MAWIDGEVLEANSEEIKVLCTSGNTVSTPDWQSAFSSSYLVVFVVEIH